MGFSYMSQNNSNKIVEYQHNFCLYPTTNEGGVIWKIEDDLMLAIVVGQNINGDRYIIHNQPEKLNYKLSSLQDFQNGEYCFSDLNNQRYDYPAIALKAFELLYSFNDYNNNTYDAEYTIVLPEKEIYQPPTLKKSIQQTYHKTIDPLKNWILNFWQSITQWYQHLRKEQPNVPQLEGSVKPLLLQDKYISPQDKEKLLSA